MLNHFLSTSAFFIKIQKIKEGSVQNETMQTLNKLSFNYHFQEVLVRWPFACGNLFNYGKMLHSSTLHTSDMKYKYMKSTLVLMPPLLAFVACESKSNLWDDTHMMSMKIVHVSRPPIPLVHLPPKFFHPLNLWRPISNDPSPLQTITN